jgi:SAM-dependent MidA family methyltransferase
MSQLLEIIRAEIASQGTIPFARFMELALYCPEYGFYERESDTVGQGGDFYTSVSVGPLFGELLAFRFAGWLEGIPNEKLQIVEAGAHDGKLALDILRWLARWRPELFERIEYVISEPSARRQKWQRERLARFAGKVRWLAQPLEAQVIPVRGIIFANELLDAMPVHRLAWSASEQQWCEWGVGWEEGGFAWRRIPLTLALKSFAWLPKELLAVLPDGFTTEVCPGAENWWSAAADSLRLGRLLTLDYGLCAEEFFAAHRAEGTLRAYRRHRSSADLLADAGAQDITAHVNFTEIQAAGEKTGLRTELAAKQADFIVGLAKSFWAQAEQNGDWSAQRSRELQTLMHPEHLGRAFRVLVQSR